MKREWKTFNNLDHLSCNKCISFAPVTSIADKLLCGLALLAISNQIQIVDKVKEEGQTNSKSPQSSHGYRMYIATVAFIR